MYDDNIMDCWNTSSETKQIRDQGYAPKYNSYIIKFLSGQ